MQLDDPNRYACIVGYSLSDGCYFAEGIYTGFLGDGQTPAEAVSQLIRATDTIIAMHMKDGTVRVFLEKPYAILSEAIIGEQANLPK